MVKLQNTRIKSLVDNKVNIFKCALKDNPEQRGFQWGPFANPFTGETNNMSASFDEDAAKPCIMAA